MEASLREIEKYQLGVTYTSCKSKWELSLFYMKDPPIEIDLNACSFHMYLSWSDKMIDPTQFPTEGRTEEERNAYGQKKKA